MAPLASFDEFCNALTINGYPKPNLNQYNSFITQAEPAGGISSKRELAMFLAQIIHESGGLQFKEETHPGEYDAQGGAPGRTYHGRGYIQLTHAYNYRAASLALYGDTRLITNPEQVASDENVAWATAFWFWKTNVHSKPGVQEGKFGATTNAINGAIECSGSRQDLARVRFQKYVKVLKAFNINEEAQEGGCYN